MRLMHLANDNISVRPQACVRDLTKPESMPSGSYNVCERLTAPLPMMRQPVLKPGSFDPESRTQISRLPLFLGV